MLLKNPLKANDWEIKQLLGGILAIQCVLPILIGMDSFGLNLVFVRQFVGFVYLTFVPGTLILRVFKVHRLSNIEAVVYTTGLSIACVMVIGLLSNLFLPPLGFNQPISTVPLLAITTATIAGLCILAYLRDKDFSDPAFFNTTTLASPALLFLCIVPVVSIAGAQLMNVMGANSLSMLLFILLAAVPLLVVFDKIPRRLYSVTVLVVALALLYNVSLISQYVTGYDVQVEYLLAQTVSTSGLWNPAIPNDYNGMLSVVMLAPIIGSICGVSVAVVFKVIYQFYFALVPLGLYFVYCRQTNDKISFLSVFYFVSVFPFFAVMTQLMRQEIAELFVVLLILLLIDKKLQSTQRSLLFIIFGFSLVVSHYGLSYLYMVLLIITVALLAFAYSAINEIRGVAHAERGASRAAGSLFRSIRQGATARRDAIPIVFVLLFIVLAFTWYTYVASSHALITYALVLEHGFSSVTTLFTNETASPTGYASSASSPMRDITRYLSLVAELFVVLGFVAVIRKMKEAKFTDGYFCLICANLAVVFVGFAIPLLFQYNTLRAYQIALIVLAPLFTLGGLALFKTGGTISGRPFTKKYERASMTALSVFLAVFLLFNSGWVYTITNDNPTQYALNSQIDAPRFSDQEVMAAQWINNSTTTSMMVCGDNYGFALLDRFFAGQNVYAFTIHARFERGADVLILFRSTNLEGKMPDTSSSSGYIDLNESQFYQSTIAKSNLVYDNQAARVYHP